MHCTEFISLLSFFPCAVAYMITYYANCSISICHICGACYLYPHVLNCCNFATAAVIRNGLEFHLAVSYVDVYSYAILLLSYYGLPLSRKMSNRTDSYRQWLNEHGWILVGSTVWSILISA
jgi:hypothetical protein